MGVETLNYPQKDAVDWAIEHITPILDRVPLSVRLEVLYRLNASANNASVRNEEDEFRRRRERWNEMNRHGGGR